MKKYYYLIIAFCCLSIGFGQIINIPNANFKNKLLQADVTNGIAKNLAGNAIKIDTNNDGQIQQTEAWQVATLNVQAASISSLIGISNFSNLKSLTCDGNQLNILNISSNTALTFLSCGGNQLTSLNVSSNTLLTSLLCGSNQLTSLNVSTNTALITLLCQSNLLTSLNVSSNTSLRVLGCDLNNLSSLNVSSNILLTTLYCNNNQLTSLSVSSNTVLARLNCGFNLLTSLNCNSNVLLTTLYCENNQLTNLNVNSNIALIDLSCSNNLLTSLYIKNSKNESLQFNNNPNLKYICADENQLADVQNIINSYGYTSTCHVNNYCSFTPGGIFYTLQGNIKLDANNNGCDILDMNYSNLKLTFSDGTNSGNLFSNNAGNYSYDVQAGTHIITPILQNPSYFNISPASATVTFPATTSPAIKDFCITTNGVHNDVEVTILPISAARPGFDAVYKIIYNNKGTTTLSGNIAFTFNDSTIDFVSATPTITSQTGGVLVWDYSNLLSFEKREIIVVLNLNSPQETPPLVAGSQLNFIATINPVANDGTALDNVFAMQQTVVNAFDPNDKTCLEGNNISPAKVGGYVNYMIRFENTGTFPAQNIVVKDMIDLAKFDIATLIPVSGSHDFYTRINDNKVEFIFENINLPFDNATNDGYVAFKIKTKSTLVLGNTFSNSANIYFDYNFPIVTNTATTTIANLLANQDFVFNEFVKIYPNPAKNILNIDNVKNIDISSISIYNILGQVVQVVTTPSKTVDVSGLKTGNYFMTITSDKGTSSSKFIKE